MTEIIQCVSSDDSQLLAKLGEAVKRTLHTEAGAYRALLNAFHIRLSRDTTASGLGPVERWLSQLARSILAPMPSGNL